MRQDNLKIEDQLLLKRACHKACGRSLSILYQKYRKPICDFLHKAGADGLAEDICHTVFMQILDEKCNYDGSGNVKSYLFGIARNICNQEALSRKTKGLNQTGLRVVGDLVFDRNTQECPAEALSLAEMGKIIEKRAKKLPDKASQAVELVYLEGIPVKKAAEIAQCEFNTFRNRLKYGLKLLLESTKKDEI